MKDIHEGHNARHIEGHDMRTHSPDCSFRSGSIRNRAISCRKTPEALVPRSQ